MKKVTREWVRKAESDLRVAVHLAGLKPAENDAASFHCQQCAEKYFKALLQERGLAIPYTHDLEDLLDLLLPHDATLKAIHRGLDTLSEYAVEFRYPGKAATARQTKAALRLAERVRLEIRRRLGLREPRPRKK
jgi:HEPN domain-containing protein